VAVFGVILSADRPGRALMGSEAMPWSEMMMLYRGHDVCGPAGNCTDRVGYFTG
jgi:hypothetical protein